VLEGVADELCRARESQRGHDLALVRFHRAGDTLRAAATSFIVRPSARSRTTSRWRGVSFSRPTRLAPPASRGRPARAPGSGTSCLGGRSGSRPRGGSLERQEVPQPVGQRLLNGAASPRRLPLSTPSTTGVRSHAHVSRSE
jgi:hypothetical protein